jgi:hypothetical protein
MRKEGRSGLSTPAKVSPRVTVRVAIGANPDLHSRHKLGTLPRSAPANDMNLRACANRGGIDRCSAFGTKGVLPLVPAFTCLDVDLGSA